MEERTFYTAVETKAYTDSRLADGDMKRYLTAVEEFVALLRDDPFRAGGKKLKGCGNEYSKAFGLRRWRLLYAIDKKNRVVTLLKLEARKKCYKR
ncbi:hypothetical protein AVEN_270453-1 [Araneus ventricosus]|uniref:Uncharacterized protein n=1 Tax=Araneus ventricosus TaxID=182803 RepID=A0A4Y2B741_ARAVE|nr:hypothetical protein AVEN_270453-1 [Araneus ventricosus]